MACVSCKLKPLICDIDPVHIKSMYRHFSGYARYETSISLNRPFILRILLYHTFNTSYGNTISMSSPIIEINNLSKVYANGFTALKDVSLNINKGEIFALLGPNGAGKTTLISIICGLVNASSGRVLVQGHDIITDYKVTRSMIGLVPQELHVETFETVWNTVNFTRGLFGKKPNPAVIEPSLT